MRSMACHSKWLQGIEAPVIRCDGSEPVEVLASNVYQQVMERIGDGH